MGLAPQLGRSLGVGNGNPLQYFLPGESHGQRNLLGQNQGIARAVFLLEILAGNRLPFTIFQRPPQGFPGGSVVKNLGPKAEDMGVIPGSGRSPGEGNGNPLQYFLPGKSHEQRNLADYSPYGRTESDTTEVTQHTSSSFMIARRQQDNIFKELKEKTIEPEFYIH